MTFLCSKQTRAPGPPDRPFHTLADRIVREQRAVLLQQCARALYRLTVYYRPSSCVLQIVVYRTFFYGGTQHTVRRFRQRTRVSSVGTMTGTQTTDSAGVLPIPRLMRIVASDATVTEMGDVREALRQSQIEATTRCRQYRARHLSECMRVCRRLRPRLPSLVWLHAVWPYV